MGYDPADPVTEASWGKIPDSYLDTLQIDALDGTRIGIFPDYFGSEGNEQLTTDLVNEAIDDMRAEGAETVELGPQPEIAAWNGVLL